MKRFWIIVGLIIFLNGAAWGADFEWLGGNGNWDVVSNWVVGGVPATVLPSAVDAVIIDDGTVNVNASDIISIDTLNLSGTGRLTLGNDITVGTANIAGTLDLVDNTLTAGSIALQTGGIINTAGGTLDSGGSITQTDGVINGGLLIVSAGGAIALDIITGNNVSSLEITGAGGAVRFTNSGTVAIAGISGVSNNSVTIETSGGGDITQGVAVTAAIDTGGGALILNAAGSIVINNVTAEAVALNAGYNAHTTPSTAGTVSVGAIDASSLVIYGASVSSTAGTKTVTGNNVTVHTDDLIGASDFLNEFLSGLGEPLGIPSANNVSRAGPVTYTWIGAVDGDWTTPGNWLGGTTPSLTGADTLVIDTQSVGDDPDPSPALTISALTVTSGTLTLGGPLHTLAVTVGDILDLNGFNVNYAAANFTNNGDILSRNGETITGITSIGGTVILYGDFPSDGTAKIAHYNDLDILGTTAVSPPNLIIDGTLTIDTGGRLTLGGDIDDVDIIENNGLLISLGGEEISGITSIGGTVELLGDFPVSAGSTKIPTYTNLTVKGSATSPAGLAVGDTLLIDSGANLELGDDTGTIAAATIQAGTLDLNNFKLDVTGDISQTGGTISANGGTLSSSGGSVIQQGGGAINSGLLIVSATGVITLNENNTVDSLEITGAGGGVGFTNSVNLEIAGISGVSSNKVTIETTDGGDITQSGLITTDGTLDLKADGKITQSAEIVAENLIVQASGLITLSNTDNAVTTLQIIGAGDDVEFTNSGVLDIVGINATGIDVTITTGGTDNDITQSGLIEANMLSIKASGAITLDDEDNEVAIFKVIGTGGDVEFSNAAPLEIAGIDAQGQQVTLIVSAAVTQDKVQAFASAILCDDLIIIGNNQFILDNEYNHVTSIVTQIYDTAYYPTEISYRDSSDFKIGAAGLQTTSTGSVTLHGGSGATVSQDGAIITGDLILKGTVSAYNLNLASGNSVTNLATGTDATDVPDEITFTNAGAIAQTQAIKTGSLILDSGTGTITLEDLGNTVDEVQVDASTGFSFVNNTALSTNTINAANGIVKIINKGVLKVDGVITANTLSLKTESDVNAADNLIEINVTLSITALITISSGTPWPAGGEPGDPGDLCGELSIGAGVTVSAGVVQILAGKLTNNGIILSTIGEILCCLDEFDENSNGNINPAGELIFMPRHGTLNLVYYSGALVTADFAHFSMPYIVVPVAASASNNVVFDGYKNVYLVNVIDGQDRTISIKANGFIEFYNGYTYSGPNPSHLTLEAVDGFQSYSSTSGTVTVDMGNSPILLDSAITMIRGSLSVKANVITLAGVNGTAGQDNNLTLNSVSGGAARDIDVSGALGDSVQPLGDITVTQVDDATFGGNVTASSYTQSAGSAVFEGAQEYSGTNASGDASFQFKGGNLLVNGTMSADPAIGNIVIDDGNTIAFNGQINAASFTQITAAPGGTTTFSAAQNYSGAFNGYGFYFVGNDLDIAVLSTSLSANSGAGGKIQITNAGLFTLNLNGAVSSGGTFEQLGLGSSVLRGDITAANPAAANASIRFATDITLAPADNGTVAIDSSMGSGVISIEGAIDSGGTNRSLEISSGSGVIFLKAAGAPSVYLSGNFTQIGTGISQLFGSIETNNGNITFNGPIELYDDISLYSGAGAGDINLNSVTRDSIVRNLTLDSGTGDITVSSNIGTAGARLGNIVINSAAAVVFNGAVFAASFTQLAGSVSTAFSGAQDYTGFMPATGTDPYSFSFTGEELVIRHTLATDTDATDDDGAIIIDNTGYFIVEKNGSIEGSIEPGGEAGTLSVSGNTANRSRIIAGPVPSGTDAVIFNGDYDYTAGGGTPERGSLIGSASAPNIVFQGSVIELGSFTHNNNLVIFRDSGASTALVGVFSHTLSQNQNPPPASLAIALGPVLIATGNTVTLGSDIYQDSDIAQGTDPGDPPARNLEIVTGAVLDTATFTWIMGDTVKPVGLTPNFNNGFYARKGGLLLHDGAVLQTADFHNSQNDPGNHEHELILPPSGMADIIASGNVIIHEQFVPTAPGTLLNSRLTMSGNNTSIALRTDPSADAGLLNPLNRVETPLGNLVIDADPVRLNSNMLIMGDLTIKPNRLLNANAADHIRVYGNWFQWQPPALPLPAAASPPAIPYSGYNDTGKFAPGTSTVEFGTHRDSAAGTDRTFIITGDTAWYKLACFEPGATLLFSNYPHTHKVDNKLIIRPVDSSGNDITVTLANPITDHRPEWMIKVDRLIEFADNGPPAEAYTPRPQQGDPRDPWTPPLNPNSYFWYFDLESRGGIDINFTKLFFSYSSKRIPLPPPPMGEWLVDASPYVYIDYDSIKHFERATDTSPENSYYDVNWYVANEFFYSFTEDYDGNGRIDRLRLQSAFEMLVEYNDDDPQGPRGTDKSAFVGFRIDVEGYEVDTSKGYNGYARADWDEEDKVHTNQPDRLDSIYVFLKEKDDNDGDARLRWTIISNPYLRDLPAKSVLIGLPDQKGLSWDTVPPRINYALTIPDSGRKEIYVQMSKPVDVSTLTVSGPGISGFNPLNANVYETAVGRRSGASEFLLTLSSDFTLADLAVSALAFPGFILSGVRDMAVEALDRHFSDEPYSYRFPSPKYPMNYEYTHYGFLVKPDENSPVDFNGMRPQNPLNSWRFDPAFVLPPNPDDPLTYPDDFRDQFGRAPHRVTDILISVPPESANDKRFFIWPVWARYTSLSGSIGSDFRPQQNMDNGIIWEFDGTRFLEERPTTLQARLHNSLSGIFGAAPVLVYGVNIPENVRRPKGNVGRGKGSGGLWLPLASAKLEPDRNRDPVPLAFINLAPRWFSGTTQTKNPPPAQLLYNYTFDENDALYKSGGKLNFFFRLDASQPDLLAARLDIKPGQAIPNEWWRLVRPFGYDIQDVTLQRGGVTILRNVINPNNNESVFIRYHLMRSGRVTLQVFTLDGTLVYIIRRNEMRAAGEYTDSWNGKNTGGRAVARGMYFIRVVGPDIDEIRKVMVVK